MIPALFFTFRSFYLFIFPFLVCVEVDTIVCVVVRQFEIHTIGICCAEETFLVTEYETHPHHIYIICRKCFMIRCVHVFILVFAYDLFAFFDKYIRRHHHSVTPCFTRSLISSRLPLFALSSFVR